MKIKHRVVRDFQYLRPDKKIFVLKTGTILDEYTYKVKTELIPIDKEIIDNNPDFFVIIEWKDELLSYMKVQKIPTPAQLHKKIVPFIEEMILSSMNISGGFQIDEDRLKEIERKESELNNREKRIKDKEEEIEIRLSRSDKRENEYKEDLKNLDRKEDELRIKFRELTEKEIDLQDITQELNEKERNFDRSLLESSKDMDIKYDELQKKIDKDLKELSEKEKSLESKNKDLKRKEDSVNQKEEKLNDIIRNFEIQKDDFGLFSEEIKKIDNEIKEWEKLHWKFKRMRKPPSIEK